MEEVKDTVSIHPHGSANRGVIRPVAHGVSELADGRGWHGVLAGAGGRDALFDGDLLAVVLAADALGDVDARFGGVAGLAGVKGVVLRRGGRGDSGGVVLVGGALRVGALALRRVAGGGGGGGGV